MSSTDILMPSKPKVRVASSSTALNNNDENKASTIVAGKIVDKKVQVKRSALGDISNVNSSQQPGGKVGKIDKLAAAPGRVKLPAKDKAPSSLSSVVVPASKLAATTHVTSVQASAVVKPALKPMMEIQPSLVQIHHQPTSLLLHQQQKIEAIIPTTTSSYISSSLPTTFVEEKQVDLMAIDEDMEEEIDDDEIAEDIDVADQDDPQCCTEYVHEIFEYSRLKEIKDAVIPHYMSKQVDISEKMRAVLIDWMVEVHVKFKLLTETMFLSVSILDRFLTLKSVPRNKLQLVGVTAMLLAAKYEEIYAPEVRDFIYISDKAITREEILKMERLILSTLDFNLSTPTPLHFLRRFSKAARSDTRTHTLSKYLIELTLPEYRTLQYVPSMIAAASVYIARCMTEKSPWNATLTKYTTYTEQQMSSCIRELNDIVQKSEKSTLKCVRRKYLSPKLMEVAKIPPVEIDF
eukprot:TRINITY_DN3779_c0_g1_i1.p1 TRINITY_DN3779_c0_g1~~TRINITY_DN3779_c0_g1_i1.p1  ORF type:complete len:463 (+),score=167.02 TRINITY_DN3779_c0_g1_i1:180-1568(+)